MVGEFAIHLALALGQKCFYTTPIKALSNQKYNDLIARYGAEQGRPADRRQRDQPARADRGDDHRGAAQHALRRQRRARRPRLRGDGRGALPRRPVPRRGLGRGDHPPARLGPAGVAVGDRVQRRGVRRLAGRGARRHPGDRARAAAGAAVAAHAGRQPDVRPVRRATTVRSRSTGRWCSYVRDRNRVSRHRARPASTPGGRPRPATGQRRPALAAAAPAGRDQPAGPRRPAAGDHLHLQPGRLRRRRPAVRGGQPAADRPTTSARRSGGSSSTGPPAWSPRTSTCSATGTSWTACSAASPPTTPA